MPSRIMGSLPMLSIHMGDPLEQPGRLGVRLPNKAVVLSLPDGDQYFAIPRGRGIRVCRVVADLALCAILVMGSLLFRSRRFCCAHPDPASLPRFLSALFRRAAKRKLLLWFLRVL